MFLLGSIFLININITECIFDLMYLYLIWLSLVEFLCLWLIKFIYKYKTATIYSPTQYNNVAYYKDDRFEVLRAYKVMMS